MPACYIQAILCNFCLRSAVGAGYHVFSNQLTKDNNSNGRNFKVLSNQINLVEETIQ